MKKIFYLVVFFIVLVACNNTEIKEHYYSNGALHLQETFKNGLLDGITTEYYETGEVKTITNFNKGFICDTLKGFYKSGNLELIQFSSIEIDSIYTFYDNKKKIIKSKGPLINDKVSGWHIVYKSDGKIASYIEFIDIGESEPYINRGFFYDTQGKIIDSLSANYNISVPENLKVNVKYPITINYLALLPKDSKVYFCYSYEIKDNFSNLKDVKLDTIVLNNQEAVLEVFFKSKGKKTLRGFFEEKRFELKQNITIDSLVDITIRTNKMYFDTSLYVK